MRTQTLFKFVALCSMTLAMSLTTSHAQLVTNADSAVTLNLGGSWIGGVPAGPANIAVWDNNVQVNTVKTLGASVSWAGIRVLDPAASIGIPVDGNSLTLGTSGIDLSQATNGLTLGCPIILNGNQTWAVTNGITLTVTGVVSGASTLTLNNGGNNNGLIILTNADTYSGGTVISSGFIQPNSINAFGPGTVTNNGGVLELIGFPHAGVMTNHFVVTGTSLIDMANVNASFVFNGPWLGTGTIMVTNDTASGSTLTFGGAGGGNMANFTGSIIVADNASTTPSAGALRFNNGGSQANTGNSQMSINLGGATPGGPASTVILENRDPGTTSVGELSGGFGTAVTGQTSGSGTEIWSIGGKGTSSTFGGTFKNQSSTALTALTKIGAGTLTLTGTNTATSTTTINAGTLQIGDGGADGTLLAGSIVNNSALVFNRSDSYTVSNNISGGGSITIQAGGTNTYTGTNSSSGILTISQGGLVLAPSGLLSCPIAVGSAGTFDISQNPTFTLNQTLSGFGTVTGLVVAVGGSINPGGNGLAGTLTLLSGLTENGGVNNQFVLSTPMGTNDLVSVTGPLTLSGVNNVQLSAFGGGTIPLGIYPLITYTGTLSGGPANFAVTAVGVTGTITNITTTTPPEIAVIISPASRGATNLTWKGDGVLNNWDNSSSNWFNGPTSFAFQAGDSVLFSDAGTPNTNVNLSVDVLPASVTFSNTLHYTISGGSSIGGSTGLTKTNSGIATILTTNSYTGPTVIGQGVLEVGNVAISGADSSIGAATSNPTNLVFYGTTLRYLGPSANTDRGATLNGSGATIDVTNATLTLNGSITGPGALALTDSGTLVLGNPNTYNGGTVISNGILAMGSNNANNNGSGSSGVGPTNEPVTFKGGTLKLFGNGASTGNNYNTFYNPLVVPAGQSGTLLMFPRGPINTGSGSGLNSPLSGGGTLTLEVNYVRDALSGDWSAFTGIIVVTNFSTGSNPDEFRINNNFGYANATIDIAGNVLMDSSLSANATINIGELDGSTNAIIGAGNASQPGPTWSIGWKNTSSTYGGFIEDDNTAPGGRTSVTKVGNGTLTLEGGVVTSGFPAVTAAMNLLLYTGSTVVSNGTLAVIVPDALSNSSNVTLAASSAILDASQMGFLDSGGNPVTNSVFEVVSSQILAGIGTIRGFLVTDAGSTFNVGLPGSTGTMTVTNAVTLGGTIQLKLNRTGSPTSDELISDSSITNGGSLIVTNVGGALQVGDTFTLFSASSYIGTFSSVTLPTLPAGQSWNTSNLYVNGQISVVASAGGPKFSSIQTSGNNIVLNASGGTPNGPVTVLTSTNLLLPVNQWTTVTTSTFDGSGNFTYTVTGALASGLPQQFYLLMVP